MRLIIVRHGETDWTLAGRYTSATDLPLTGHGSRQAAALAALLERVLDGHHAEVLSSPRQRATQTAALALPGRPVTLVPLLAEYDYGDLEGLTTAQIRRRTPGWDIWTDGCPHGESTADVSRRADAVLRAHGGGSGAVLVVTHGHFSRILAARALGLPGQQGRLLASATASVSVIEDHHGERCIGLWNQQPTLPDRTADRDIPPAAARGDRPASSRWSPRADDQRHRPPPLADPDPDPDGLERVAPPTVQPVHAGTACAHRPAARPTTGART